MCGHGRHLCSIIDRGSCHGCGLGLGHRLQLCWMCWLGQLHWHHLRLSVALRLLLLTLLLLLLAGLLSLLSLLLGFVLHRLHRLLLRHLQMLCVDLLLQGRGQRRVGLLYLIVQYGLLRRRRLLDSRSAILLRMRLLHVLILRKLR